jgi:YegS/Rv2252/BmrU family lipid kinase
MGEYWYFIINPASGSGKGLSIWKQVQDHLNKSEIEYSFDISDYHKHTIELVSQKYKDGIRHFVGIGGDGTINEIINGLVPVYRDGVKPVVGLIPVGTGNDWVRNFKNTCTAENIVQKVQDQKYIVHDIGQLEVGAKRKKYYFVNVAGAGIDGQVVQNLELLNSKGKSGKLSYLISAIKALLDFKSPESKCFVGNDEKYDGKTLLVTASLGQYFGGGMHLSPKAEFNKNKLDFTIVRSVSNWIVFPQLYKLFNGKIESVSFVNKYQDHKGKMINSKEVPIQADGEFVGRYKQINFSVITEALLVLN